MSEKKEVEILDDKHPRVLVISDAAWADDNNIGNTFSNIFQDWPLDSMAMIYARPSLPNTYICQNFFQISEVRLLKGLFNKEIKSGIKLDVQYDKGDQIISEGVRQGNKIYSFFLKFRLTIFLLAREVLWKISSWKTKELNEFIDEYKPQIVFSLACQSLYMGNLQRYVIERAKTGSLIYFVDDIYSFKQLSISPFYWIFKMLIRRNLRNTVAINDEVYTINPMQKREYDKYFNIESKLLRKGGHFKEFRAKKVDEDNIKFIYTGNVYAGRWKTLMTISEEVEKAEGRISFEIYSTDELSRRMLQQVSLYKNTKFLGAIPSSKVSVVQEQADVLVHVESLGLKQKLITRLSFSTKLIDYMSRGRTIFAVGWNKSASIDYLEHNKLAIVAYNKDDITTRINSILENTIILSEYAKRSWGFGRKYHNSKEISTMVYSDFKEYSTLKSKGKSYV